MDGNQFDAFAKGLAAARTRRGVLRVFGAAALGAAGLVRFGGAGATPSCREAGHPCEGNQTCCAGLVCAVSGPGAALRCTAPSSSCSAGEISCGGKCIPACTASDPCHVAGVCDPSTGACTNPAKTDGAACDDGNACTQTDTCQAGVCVGGNPVVCPPLNSCRLPGSCDPATGQCQPVNAPDGTTCRGSSDMCMINGHCVNGDCVEERKNCDLPHALTRCDFDTGTCLLLACNGGYQNCNGNQSDGCETHTMVDLNNCGACGHICPAQNGTPSCANGTCGITCDPGFANCDKSSLGCHNNLATSENHCGACHHACDSGQTCISGVCQ